MRKADTPAEQCVTPGSAAHSTCTRRALHIQSLCETVPAIPEPRPTRAYPCVWPVSFSQSIKAVAPP
jgi:hypothetical protein